MSLAGISAAEEYFGPILADRDCEMLAIALVDDQLRLLRLIAIPGTKSEVTFDLATVLREALIREATGIIVAHNHPSGDPAPSSTDLMFTRRLAAAADAIGITLVDHLIFNERPVVSLRRAGKL